MQRIIKDGVIIGMAERPNYIRYNPDTETCALCIESEAQGVAYEGEPYHIYGKAEMAGTEASVTLEYVDAGVPIYSHQSILDILLGTESEVTTNAQ